MSLNKSLEMQRPPPPPSRGRRTTAVSLSPAKTRKVFEPPKSARNNRRSRNNSSPKRNVAVALSKAETVLVSGNGDVLVCRCRHSSKAYTTKSPSPLESSARPEPMYFWWEGDTSCNAGSCLPCGEACGGAPSLQNMRGGLLGGGPEVQTDSLHSNDIPTEINSMVEDKDSPAVVSQEDELSSSHSTDDMDGLAAPPSFDYSHITAAGDGNDMIPDTQQLRLSTVKEQHDDEDTQQEQAPRPKRVSPPALFHGVPTFLPAFYQVRITQVSANPLGSHVLLISAEALLFSYGLNDHGQLGHGQKLSVKDETTLGFCKTPTIVTPLLENGGKAIACAAGVDYSLVVVKTEGRRLGGSRTRGHHRRGTSDGDAEMSRASSLPSRIAHEEHSSSANSEESMCHHQLYGFGCNEGKKLGLVNPATGKKAQEDVLLPRRVALHCKVWPEKSDTPSGIFGLAASAQHSAALVRRATGAIELYTWGDATSGALGPIVTPPTTSTKNGKVSPLPTSVSVPTLVNNLTPERKVPIQVALGPTSTFVVTACGQAFSFGTSDTGLLGLGDGITKTEKPKSIVFPSGGNCTETRIQSINVGARHAVAVSADGRAFCWGKNEGKIMGFDSTARKHLARRARRGQQQGRDELLQSCQDEVEWIPRVVDFTPTPAPARGPPRRFPRSNSNCAPPRRVKEEAKAVRAFAGYDSTVFVTDSGAVLSCGLTSGRLGLGEGTTKSTIAPTPMFGGLHLWKN